jgi:cytochrome c oxidase subunit 4
MSTAMSEHIVSVKTYITIWLALLVLTGLTAGIAFVDLGPFNTVVALVIATGKALLVVLIFMHVKYASDRLTKVVLVSALFWLFLLLGLSLADYTTRTLR